MKKYLYGLTLVLALVIAFRPGVKAQNIAGGTVSGTTLTATNATNQLVLGTTNTVTISSTAPGASRTITLDDPGVSTGHLGVFAAAPTATLQNQPQTAFVTGSAYTNGTTGFTSVTGLSFAVAANTNYSAICRLLQKSTTGGAGNDLKLQFTGPSAPTAVAIEWTHGETTTTVFNATATAFASAMDPNQSIAANTDLGDTVHIALINGANAGTVQLQAALHTAAGNATIEVGSSCQVQ